MYVCIYIYTHTHRLLRGLSCFLTIFGQLKNCCLVAWDFLLPCPETYPGTPTFWPSPSTDEENVCMMSSLLHRHTKRKTAGARPLGLPRARAFRGNGLGASETSRWPLWNEAIKVTARVCSLSSLHYHDRCIAAAPVCWSGRRWYNAHVYAPIDRCMLNSK